MSSKDFATILVDKALSEFPDRFGRIIQDAGLQKVTITRKSMMETVREIYIELYNTDKARWPQIDVRELEQAGSAAFDRARVILTQNETGKY